jgi:paraquat-inducible protein A
MKEPWPDERSARGARLLECRECGLRCALRVLPANATARCRRCGAPLVSHPANSLQRSLALALTGIVLVIVANTMPFMSLEIAGRYQQASLMTGAVALFDEGLWELAALVMFTTIVAPALKLGAIAYVLLGLSAPRPPSDLPLVFSWLERLRPWSMIEVYLLGVFVAYVKLAALATIEIGVACYALGSLMLIMVLIDWVLSPELVWEAMEDRGLVPRPSAGAASPLLLCEACDLVAPVARGSSACPRCGGRRHFRKPESVTRTWALVLTAIVLWLTCVRRRPYLMSEERCSTWPPCVTPADLSRTGRSLNGDGAATSLGGS